MECMKCTSGPSSKGMKIPPKLHNEICQQVENFACKQEWYPAIQLPVRFRGQFCYIDMLDNRYGEESLFPLCRLRFLNQTWSIALFTWSNEKYTLYSPYSVTHEKFKGTIEEALVLCEAFINRS